MGTKLAGAGGTLVSSTAFPNGRSGGRAVDETNTVPHNHPYISSWLAEISTAAIYIYIYIYVQTVMWDGVLRL